MRIGNLGLGNEVAYGAEGIETFCNRPGETFLFGFVLDVAASEIDGDEVT